MNVLVLADDWQKEELLSLPIDNTIRIKWAETIAGIKADESFDACIDLLFDDNPERVEWLKNLRTASSGQSPLIIINAVSIPLKDIREDFIRVNAWNTFLKRPVIEAAAFNSILKVTAEELFSNMGRKTEWVPDIPGFITPRVVASIINEAFFALEEKVSTEEEIDTAMKTGTNYPYGPFEWGKKIGLQHIYSLLTALSKEQSRYQPSALLKQTVLA
jgi:3-hydroxybutyryl-CoA dehydrogenase